MNPLFGQLNQGNQNNDLIKRFSQFKQSFSGNPQEQIQQLPVSFGMTAATHQ